MHPNPRRHRARAATLFLVLALGGPSLSAMAGSSKEADSIEQAKASMLRIQNQIKNARMKLTNGIVGVRTSATPRGAMTPARKCCSSNLEGLDRNLAILRETLERLVACYDAAENADGVAAAQFARQDLGLVERSIQEFELATGERQASTAIGPMTRNFNALRESLEKLEPCAEPGSKKRKRKGKRKRDRATDS